MRFRKIDKKYLKERKDVSNKHGLQELWEVIDQWPLYCGISNLARFLSIANILKDTINIPGHIAEFGSWKGANLLFMAKLLRIYDHLGPKAVYCFDSFEGLNAFDKKDGRGKEGKGRYAGNLGRIKDIIKLYEMSDDIVIHKGLIEDTLPRVLKENKALTFSLVYCDTDLYKSTQTILTHIHPRLAKGGVMVFDEWNCDSFPGEGVAVNEFLEKMGNKYKVESVPLTRQPSLLLRKIRV
ncbi:MAG: class I SAM-dependent methyltransferase [Candidatus Omnitrophica bacterium]|nr:class I SAM-dependent methyltransferase [Candidatus Omnitrophota bacterium]